MDASLRSRAERLASEIASQARTAEDLNGLMRLMMKSALERMLNTEMDVHLGRSGASAAAEAGHGRARRRRLPGLRRQRRRPSALRTVATAVRRRRCKATWAS